MILSRLRSLDPGQPLRRILFYRFCFRLSWLILKTVFRAKYRHLERAPDSSFGPMLIIANHQSHLDPPAVGTAIRRRNIVPIARQGLFKSRILGWIIANLNSIAINEKEGDTVAIRKAVKELAAGRCVLIFPEGSRTYDGKMQPFKRGAWLLLSRAKCPVLPVGVAGLYQAWPRTRSFPRLFGNKAEIVVGHPIPYEQLESLGPDAGIELMSTRIAALVEEAEASLDQRWGRRPSAEPAPTRS